ncbi:MAG: tetratricopeptide repeat protein [Chlamydiota bacterium]
MSIRRILSCLAVLTLLSSCCLNQDVRPANLQYKADKTLIDSKESPFAELSDYERSQPWGAEMLIGRQFARDLDLYRAITTFKRALILMPEKEVSRRHEVEYDILLSYYTGNKYCEAVAFFEQSSLPDVRHDFPAYHDMLVILYDSYQRIGDVEDAEVILQLLDKRNYATADKLAIASKMIRHDHSVFEQKKNVVKELEEQYLAQYKSPSKARWANAILPGAGYYYVDQKQSAFTSFVINGLFIAAAYHFFDNGNTAAGIITAGFEAGWYFGGINGAGIAAQEYNQHLFEKRANTILEREQMFPVLMLNYSF